MYIYRIQLFDNFEVYEEKYFKNKEDALKEIEYFKKLCTNIIKSNCYNYFNLKWIKDDTYNNTIESYSVYYEWEYHCKGCNKIINIDSDCSCGFGYINSNIEYPYTITVTEIYLH